MITLSEPNGVTNIGGAKEYAAKFATNGEGMHLTKIKSRTESETYIHPTPLTAHQRLISG
jgi:hypothetical protein